MNYLAAIFTIAGIHLLALMSPGPDFVLIAKNSLAHSRQSGTYSALGLATGMLTHIAYCLAGLGVLIAKSIILFNIIKIAGAVYLIYIGFRALTSKAPTGEVEVDQGRDLSKAASFKMGYLTNITNPKVTLFVLSLFTLVISPTTPLVVKLIMGLEMALATAIWFSLVSYLVSHPRIKKPFTKIQHKLEQAMGGILILFGLKVAFLSSK